MIKTHRDTQKAARRSPRSPCVFVRSGFTIQELVVSLVITAMILGALTSAMLLASQIIPNDQRPATTNGT